MRGAASLVFPDLSAQPVPPCTPASKSSRLGRRLVALSFLQLTIVANVAVKKCAINQADNHPINFSTDAEVECNLIGGGPSRKSSMDEQGEPLPPGHLPLDYRGTTDALCLHFSWPVFCLTLPLFLFVIYVGGQFSFLHPSDRNGLRCGIDNRRFHPNLSNFLERPYLASDSRCVSQCPGKAFVAFCIPADRRQISQAPLKFRVAADAALYWPAAVYAVIGALVAAFPLYLICARMTVCLSYASTVVMGILAVLGLSASLYFHLYTLALTIVIGGTLYFVITFLVKRRIHIISPLISTSLSYMTSSKTAIIAPLFVIVTGIIAFSFTVLGVLFAYGIGQPAIDKSHKKLSVVKHNSLNATVLLFPFVGIWMLEFFIAWARSSIALVVSSNYFKRRVPSFVEALSVMAGFHSGTLFFGSFAVLLLENFSILLQIVGSTIKSTQSVFVKFLCKCVMSVCFCIVQFVGEVNRLSFIFTAMKGFSFWDGCKEAAEALKIDSVLSIDLLLHNVFLSVRLCITAVTAIITYLYVDTLELAIPWISIAAIPALVYIALAAIDVTIGTSSETILVCLCEDAKDEGLYSPECLQDVTTWLKEKLSVRSYKA
jgi:hypothetical protein